MRTTKEAARYLARIWDTEKYVHTDLVEKYDTPLKLAHKLTAEQRALNELHSSVQVLIRHMMDEALHEATVQAAERVNVALRKVKIT